MPLFTRYFTCLLCCAGFLPVRNLSAQVDNPAAVYAVMQEMEGSWYMETERGDRLEIWTVQDDSTMTGRGLRVKPESRDTVLLETLRLELRGDTITYWALVRGQNAGKAIPFILTEEDDEGAWIFENPAHDDPTKIRYWLLDNQEMQVTTEGKRNGRSVKNEFVFEREFSKGSARLIVRAGANWFNLRQQGSYPMAEQPAFGGRPGWDFGVQIPVGNEAKWLNFNMEAGLSGRSASVQSDFTIYRPDTTVYLRDVNYRQIWLTLAIIPEIRFRSNSPFSVMAGPYFARLLYNGAAGEELPGGENKLFDSNNDFKKRDLGFSGGFQYRFKGKKQWESVVGLRGNLGLLNLDNLYQRICESTGTDCTAKIGLWGISAYYGVNLIR